MALTLIQPPTADDTDRDRLKKPEYKVGCPQLLNALLIAENT